MAVVVFVTTVSLFEQLIISKTAAQMPVIVKGIFFICGNV
jgi:coenzyme F420-reducing hydrogenase alpha subunit